MKALLGMGRPCESDHPRRLDNYVWFDAGKKPWLQFFGFEDVGNHLSDWDYNDLTARIEVA